jgi:hypothetical protein
MVGGIVIEVVPESGRVWLNVRDKVYTKDTCAIYVERTPEAMLVSPGDSVWWQGEWAMWTPQSYLGVGCQHREHVDCTGHAGTDYDIRIPRASYSGVGRPAGHDVFDHDLISAD